MQCGDQVPEVGPRLLCLGPVASQHDNLVDPARSKPTQSLGCFPRHLVGQPQHSF